MSSAVFEPVIPTSGGPQTIVLDRSATGNRSNGSIRLATVLQTNSVPLHRPYYPSRTLPHWRSLCRRLYPSANKVPDTNPQVINRLGGCVDRRDSSGRLGKEKCRFFPPGLDKPPVSLMYSLIFLSPSTPISYFGYPHHIFAYVPVISHDNTRLFHPIYLELITLITFDERYKSWPFSIRSFVHPPITSSCSDFVFENSLSVPKFFSQYQRVKFHTHTESQGKLQFCVI